MSWRRLDVLLEQLPPTARSVVAVKPSAAWGPTEHLLAAAVDALRGANWQRSGKGPRPKPIERPGDRVQMGTARPAHEVRDLLNRWRSGDLHARERRVVRHGG